MEASTEFILQCNINSGFIEQVVYAKETLDTSALLNQPLLFCLSPESVQSGKLFLDDIRLRGKAENYTLGLLLRDELFYFVFSGVLLQNHIIIIARQAKDPQTPQMLTEKLVNQEVEATIISTPDNDEAKKHPEVTVWDLLEEMSRLNNELINTKRELVRKNMELERLQKQLKGQ